MSNVETAIEEMIQTYIDEQDYVTGMTAEMYTDGEISDLRADMEGELGELQSRIEALEEFKALEDKAREDKALDLLDTVARAEIDSVTAKALEEQEPRAVNQIDWIMTHHGLIAGYDSKATLEAYVRSMLPVDQTHQAEMLIAMVLTTARNIINKKLEAES